jgi:hypothetical protein
VDLLVDLQTSLRLVELQAEIALVVTRLAVEVLVAEEMRLLEEALITLRAVVVAVLDVVSLLVVEEVDLLKELFGADLEGAWVSVNPPEIGPTTHLTTELWLFQVHLPVGEQTARRLQDLPAVRTRFIAALPRLHLRNRRLDVTTLVLLKQFDSLKLQVAFAANLKAVNGRLVVVQVAFLRIRRGAV